MCLGFIGCGNMATAMMRGIIANHIAAAKDIIGADLSEAMREKAATDLGIEVTADNKEAAQKADILVLAVKPQFYEMVIDEIKDVVDESLLIVTIEPGENIRMAGKTVWKAGKAYPNNAQYTSACRRGHYRSLPECKCDRRGNGAGDRHFKGLWKM